MRHCIKTLYKNCTSKILINGHLSSPFPIKRSVRQGCPLSPTIFILVIESLITKIKNDNYISTIQIPSFNTPKVAGYADDNTLILKDTRSANRAIDTYDIFGEASNAKVNIGKSKAMKLGGLNKDIEAPRNMTFSVELKTLGIITGYFDHRDRLWANVLKSFKISILPFKTTFEITFAGRARIANSIILSKIWHFSPF